MQIRMIRIKEHPVSEMYARICKKSWDDLNYNVKYFDAVTPKDLVYRKEILFKEGKFSDTEKAVWYSHFDLWKICASSGETMIILEHDSYLHNKIAELRGNEFKFLSYINRDFGRHTGIHLAPGSGYFLTPKKAKSFVHAATTGKIKHNLDGFIGWADIKYHSRMVGVAKDNPLDVVRKSLPIEQINIDGWNTIDHNNPENRRKFIGDNYEDFDIPSIHRQAI